ncbi:MAG: ornithine cyclodeaminase family protein [Imperialibacter sp.]|uniref:ornithine cyclodeaminase family protein n=1 Tax=Imperialibacter sp. TaxID=2038411 RepID=UPI003A85E12F
MLILQNDLMGDLLSLSEVIDVVEKAMIAYEKQEVIVPLRMHIEKGKNTMICMPAWGDRYFANKLVNVFPANRDKNLPVNIGALVLNDAETGEALALMNASKITALRTGALGAIGIKYLTPADTSSFGLIGCGVMGIHLAALTCRVRKISTIHYLHRSDSGAARLTTFMQTYFPDVAIMPNYSAEELLSKTNAVIAATPSPTPVLPNDSSLLKGKCFISIGSFKPSMQELPDEVFRLAGKLFMDSEFARVEPGDCINPVKKGILKETDLLTLGKLITKDASVDVQQTTAYKSAGMAVYDLFVAQAMYERALQSNRGTQVAF